jgi:hypothetical protein
VTRVHAPCRASPPIPLLLQRAHHTRPALFESVPLVCSCATTAMSYEVLRGERCPSGTPSAWSPSRNFKAHLMPPNAALSSPRADSRSTTQSPPRAAVWEVFAHGHQSPALWRDTSWAGSSDSARFASRLSGILVIGSLRRPARALLLPVVCRQALLNSLIATANWTFVRAKKAFDGCSTSTWNVCAASIRVRQF